ncbi:MAG: ribbon-helix-helix protein, CopG family [Candidatus Altiarchaeales archaeon]|nr:ribbon-helix-helix protein, CopG family [Candidatus Altiarchaeales archaeon]
MTLLGEMLMLATVIQEGGMPQMPMLPVRVPEPDIEELKKIAKKRGMGVSELVRRLLSKALRDKTYEQV